MDTETSEAHSDDHQVLCYIIKQLLSFQLLYIMLICTNNFLLTSAITLVNNIFFGAYYIMYNSWKVHNCILRRTNIKCYAAWISNVMPHQYQKLRRTNIKSYVAPISNVTSHQYQNRVYAPDVEWEKHKIYYYMPILFSIDFQ